MTNILVYYKIFKIVIAHIHVGDVMDTINHSSSEQTEDRFVPMRRDEINPQLMEIISAVLDLFPDLPVSVRKIIAMAYDPKPVHGR